MPTLCLCGIDTGTGKTMATGLLARYLIHQEKTVITQKLVQTGCDGRSEDILLHRHLMASPWNRVDEQGLTCPYCLPFPGSPHLAAELNGRAIDPQLLHRATCELEQLYQWVLIEGTGGLLVPLTQDLLLIDYVAENGYPLILITSARLGSINHTLLSLEAIRARNLNLRGLVYNQHDPTTPKEIVQDSLQVFSRALKQYGFADRIVVLPKWSGKQDVDWQPLIPPANH